MSQEVQRKEFGAFRLGPRLGLGGMAEVCEAYHPTYGQVALKRMLPSLRDEPKFVAMFEDEARATAAVDHPNVVHVYEYSHFQGEPYLALELIDGPDVSRIVRSAARQELVWNLGRALALPYQLLSGLEAIHNCRNASGKLLELVHRDISPGNLFLQSSGGLKIGDFGIVAGEEVERRTEPGQLKGKLGYMSPEQAFGKQPAQQSDLYSAGIITAELLMLRPLFRGGNDDETLKRNTKGDISNWLKFNQNVPEPLRQFVQKALSFRAESRFRSASEMLEALKNASQRCSIHLTTQLAQEQVTATLQEIKAKSGSFRATELLRALSSESGARQRPPGSEDVSTSTPPTEISERSKRSVYALTAELIEAQTSARIVLRAENEWLEFELQHGEFRSCIGSSSEHLLGQLAVQDGVLSPQALPHALHAAREKGLRLGLYLIEEMNVRRQTVEHLLNHQYQLRLGPWMCRRSVDFEI